MKILTVENIVSACGATLVNGDSFKEKEIKGVAIDSRKVEKDFLFFAIKGEKTDGHEYIKAAFDNGAAAVICERVPEGEEGICIVVEDTVEALKKLATYYREQLGIKVVGVTGSIGKTTTKEFIATVLSQKYNVFRTEKNQNNLIGLPLSILNIQENNEVAVLEMGISEFGEMTKLSEIAKPDICVITNISACHLETLGSLDGVLKAKTEIFEHMNPEGEVCLCGDDERLASIEEVKGKKPVTFGFDEKNEVHPTKIVNRGLWGSEVTVENGEGMFNVSIPLAGRHMIMDALAAVSVARILEVSPEQTAFGISCVKALSGRNNLIQKNSITIIDDCYNASPESMKSALDLLTEAITPTVAILGDMLEQGENEEKGHEEVGKYAVEKGINTIVCVGPLSKKMYDKALAESSVKANTEVLYFETVDEAIENLNKFVKKDDTVLIKASNGMHFNRILEAITDDERKDSFEKREEKLFEVAQKVPDDELIGEIKDVTPSDAPAEEVKEENAESTESSKTKKRKSADQKEKESAGVQLGIIIALVVVAIIAGLIAFGIIKHNKYKEATQGQVVYLASNQYSTKGLIEDNVIAKTSDGIIWKGGSDFVQMGYDGKYFYYAVPDGGNYEIFVTGKAGKNKKSVEKNIRRYEILDKGGIIFISGNGLYTYNPKKDEINLISDSVSRFMLNEKKTEVVYFTYDGDLCRMKVGEPESSEIIDTAVTSFEYADKKFKTVYYLKKDSLYVSKKGKPSLLISEDAKKVYFADKEKKSAVYFNDSDGALFYYSSNKKEAVKVTNDGKNVYGGTLGYASFMVYDGDWKFVNKDKIYSFKEFTPGTFTQIVGADSKRIYFLSNEETKNNVGLYSASAKGFGKEKKVVTEATNVDSVEYIGEGYLFVLKDDGAGKKDLYEREKLVARNIEPGSLKKTEYGNDYVFAYQVKDADGFYKIVLYDGKTIKDVGSSLDIDVVALSKKKIYFRAKGDNKKFAVKYFNGRKVKTYKESIEEFKYIQY